MLYKSDHELVIHCGDTNIHEAVIVTEVLVPSISPVPEQSSVLVISVVMFRNSGVVSVLAIEGGETNVVVSEERGSSVVITVFE